MSELIQKLNAYGAETTGTLKRFLNDEVFYKQCLHNFVVDDNFAILEKAISEKNCAAAFTSAHALKGLASTLGLVPFMTVISPLVSSLKNSTGNSACSILNEYYPLVKKELDQIAKLLQ